MKFLKPAKVLLAVLFMFPLSNTMALASAPGQAALLAVEPTQAAQNTDLLIDIPEINEELFVQSYGSYSLKKDTYITPHITWEGDGTVLFLYTPDYTKEEEVRSLVKRGFLPLVPSDKTLYNTLTAYFTFQEGGTAKKLNFTANPNHLIYWPGHIPEDGNYTIFVLAWGGKNITNIQGAVTLNNNFKPGDTLPPMNWKGIAGETPTDTGALFRSTNFTGSKGIYDFTPKEPNNQTIKINSSLTGDFDVVFLDSGKKVVHSIPGFTGEKEVTLPPLPEGPITILIYGHDITGVLSVAVME